MGSVTPFLLYFALAILCVNADFTQISKLYEGPTNDFVAIGLIGGSTGCGAPRMLIITNATSGSCYFLLNATTTIGEGYNATSTYDMVDLGCPSSIATATQITCPFPLACFALNPTTKTLVFLSPKDGSLDSTKDLDISFMVGPQYMHSHKDISSFNLFVYGNQEVVLTYWTFDTYDWQDFLSFGTLPITSAFPKVDYKAIIGFNFKTAALLTTTNTLRYANVANSLDSMTFVNLPFAPGTYNTITDLGTDNFNTLYIYDATKLNLVAVNSTTIKDNIRNITLPFHFNKFFMQRQQILAIDSQAIWSFQEPFSYNISWTNKTCDSVPGRINVTVSGGSFPLTLVSQPDGIKVTVHRAGTYSLSIVGEFFNNKNITMMDEGMMNNNWGLIGSASTFPSQYGWVGSDVITPYTGQLSMEVGIEPNRIFAMKCMGSIKNLCINASQHEYFTFALNVGAGGQAFAFTCNSYAMYFDPGDLPINTWVPFKIHISQISAPLGADNGFASCQITRTDPSNANLNPVYIDAVQLIRYENDFPTRNFFVCDQCGIQYRTLIPYVFNPFRVEIKANNVSCYPNDRIAASLSNDGTLEAVVTQGGVGPFKYSWRYGTGAGFNSTNVTGMPIMNSHIIVYDNALNASWTRANLPANLGSLNATKYARSAPYSISFSPKNNTDSIGIQSFYDVNTVDFPWVEFWVNGGDVGGQKIMVYITKFSITGVTSSNTNQFLDLQEFELIPNTWVKVRMTIAYNVNAAVKVYDTIALYANLNVDSVFQPFNLTQPTVYIDDISLIPRVPSLTVTDSNGCPANAYISQIRAPEPLEQSVSVTNAKCFGKSDGVISVSMQGGRPPYVFSWDNSYDNDSVLAGVGESQLNFTVADSNMCQFFPSKITVLQPPQISISIDVKQPKCHGGTGIATATAVGGAGTYSFSWVGLNLGMPNVLLQPTPAPFFLDAPTYPSVSVKGATISCQGTGSYLNINYTPSHAGYCSLSLFTQSLSYARLQGCEHCFSPDTYNKLVFWIFSDNQAALNGITLAFTSSSYNYSDPVFISSFATLVPNAWTQVSIPYDRINGIHHPDGIYFNQTVYSLVGANVLVDDIVVLTNASAGAGYGVGPGFESTVEIRAAEYYVTVVDGNGCTLYKILNVTEPEDLNINYTVTSPTNSNDNDGTATVIAYGGLGPYSYEWVDIGVNSSTGSITGLGHGAHSLRVVDANGCSRDFQVFLNTYTPPEYVREYNSKLSSGLAALVAIGLLLSIFSAIMLYRYWVSFSTLGSFLSSMILVGCVLSFLSALVLLPEPTDALCTSFIWFLGVGFVLVYGCLFIKAWALYKVWRNAVKYQKAHLTPLYIVKCLCLAVTVEIIFLAVWTAVDPPKVHRMRSVNNSFEMQCNTNNITFWIIFLAAKGAWLVFGAVLSVLTRNIAREINESTSIAYAIYNNVLLGAIAIPLALLLGEVPGGRLTVIVVIIALAFTFTMVVVFFKIWHSIMLPEKIIVSSSEMRSREKRNTASSTTRTSTSVSRASGKASSSDSGTDAAV